MGAGKKLWGWYKAGVPPIWVPIQVDDEGRVIVDMSAVNLDDIGDVDIAGAIEGDMLYFDATSGTWMLVRQANLANILAALTILGDLADVTIAELADGHFLSYSEGLGYWQNRLLAEGDIPNLDASKITTGTFVMARLPAAVKTCSLTYIIDGAGAAIAIGEKGHLEIPFACTLTAWTLLADVAGAIVVDVWKDTYANFPPTNADAMPGAGKEPTIAATNQKAQDTDISDWITVAIAAGDILAFNVDSCSAITRVTISLKAERS